jgi:hypothetical protein
MIVDNVFLSIYALLLDEPSFLVDTHQHPGQPELHFDIARRHMWVQALFLSIAHHLVLMWLSSPNCLLLFQ